MNVLGVSSDRTPIPAQPATTSATSATQSYRVLLAEDNKVNQTLATGVLKQLGHTVEIAENGRQAIEAWEAGGFDIILMDVQMPEMDGLDAVQVIREREKKMGTHVPVIAMTAHAMKGDRERCIDAGMDEYLSKPVRRQDLSNMIAVVMGKGQKRTGAAAVEHSNSIIDWQDALEVAGGDRDLLMEVISAFLEEAETLMRRISYDVRNKDAAALRKDAHTLKGGLLGVGAKRISAVVFELERMGIAGDASRADSKFQELESQMAALLPTLKQGPPL
jgi:CheY-like chemotaxis protein/HPt (histidine-containing phosphotransfer) domain-containing protein